MPHSKKFFSECDVCNRHDGANAYSLRKSVGKGDTDSGAVLPFLSISKITLQNVLYVLHYHNNLPDCLMMASNSVNKLSIMRCF